MNNQRALLRISFVLAAFGTVSLMAMLSRSSLSSIRPVDLVHLIGTGMCFGGAIVAFVAYHRGKHIP